MEETLGFNPQKICPIPRCPNKTSVRFLESDEGKRMDLCKQHALPMWRMHRDKLEVLGAWNELTMEELMNDETVEEIEIDPDHPWVEAAASARPMPVPTQAKWDLVTLQQPGEEGEKPKEVPAVLLTCITPSGVQNYFFDPQFFQQFIYQGAMVLQEIGEAIQKAEQGKLIVADKGMERQVIAEQAVHSKIREGR